MNLPLKPLAVLAALTLCSSAYANSSQIANPLTCTDEEIDKVIQEYKANLGKPDNYFIPRYEEFRQVRMATRSTGKDGDKNLCDILSDPNYSIPSIDWSKIEKAWAALRAAMAAGSGGMDWSKVMAEAYAAGMAKTKEWLLSNTCTLAENFSTAVNGSIDEAYEESKSEAFDKVESNGTLNDLGINDLSKPLYKQVAEQQTENQLGDYSNYTNWYESDWDKNMSDKENIENIVDNILGGDKGIIDKGMNDAGEDLFNEHVKDKNQNKLDDILDKLEPNYN